MQHTPVTTQETRLTMDDTLKALIAKYPKLLDNDPKQTANAVKELIFAASAILTNVSLREGTDVADEVFVHMGNEIRDQTHRITGATLEKLMQ